MDTHPEQDHACGDVLRLSGRSGTSDHQGSLFPQEAIQMNETMWKQPKSSKHLSLLPSNWTRAVAAGYQLAGLLCVFGNWLLLLVVGAKVGQWDWHHSTTASCTLPSPNYQKNDTVEKFHVTKVCLCSPKMCFVPALALMQGCLLFVVVNILANNFYFGMEIIP